MEIIFANQGMDAANYLKQIWVQLCLQFTQNNPLVEQEWLFIQQSHSEKGRHYHILNHLHYMFLQLELVKNETDNLLALSFAIFYHDVVYNAKRKDNELASAEIACEKLALLNVPSEIIALTEKHILATQHHKLSSENDTNTLLDLDLAILGDTPENYKTYTQNIRKEYAMYPNFLYKPARKKVLKHFLQMEHIFKTPYFTQHFEQQARANLQSELEG
jgi:predicted metal-dependent HD superfamily phosphohydrolase